MRCKIIKIPLYDISFKVYVGDIVEIGKRYGIEVENSTHAFMADVPKNKKPYKRIIVFPENINFGTLAHECVHLVNSVLQHIGYTLDFNNDEHYCYLIEYVTNEVYTFYTNEKK